MVKKVLVSLALAGSATVGWAGSAQAVPRVNCSNAPAMTAQLQAEENQVNAALASLQTMAASGKHGAWWLQRSIALLTHAEHELAAHLSKLQQLCPPPASSGTGSGAGLLVG